MLVAKCILVESRLVLGDFRNMGQWVKLLFFGFKRQIDRGICDEGLVVFSPGVVGELGGGQVHWFGFCEKV